MYDVTVFDHAEFGKIRTIQINGEPWFVGKDVCLIFRDKNHNRSLRRVDKEDKQEKEILDSLGRKQKAICINESGLYALLFSMQPQKAHNNGVSNEYPTEIQARIEKLRRFKRWVTNEVLPSIRKHGVYMTDQKAYELIHNPDNLANLLTQAAEQLKQKDLTIKEMKPKADFFNAVSKTDSTILIGELAKVLRQNNIPIGEKRLFEWLREHGYLIKRAGSDLNVPTQKAMELELFTICEKVYYEKPDKPILTKTPRVTGKGQQYFVRKFQDMYGLYTSDFEKEFNRKIDINKSVYSYIQ